MVLLEETQVQHVTHSAKHQRPQMYPGSEMVKLLLAQANPILPSERDMRYQKASL